MSTETAKGNQRVIFISLAASFQPLIGLHLPTLLVPSHLTASAQHAGLERMLLSLCIGDKLSFLCLASTTNTVLKICFTETFSHLYLWKNPCSLHYWGLITLIFHAAQFNLVSRRIQRGRQNMCVQFTFMNPPTKKNNPASYLLLVSLF